MLLCKTELDMVTFTMYTILEVIAIFSYWMWHAGGIVTFILSGPSPFSSQWS